MSALEVVTSVSKAARIVEKALNEEQAQTKENLDKALEILRSSAKEVENWLVDQKILLKKLLTKRLDRILNATDKYLEEHLYEEIPKDMEQKIHDILYEVGRITKALINSNSP